EAWGRAVGREHLDTELLDAAERAGARTHQPWTALSIEERAEGGRVTIVDRDGGTRTIDARVVVAAHGSWEGGSLPSHPQARRHRAADLLGFKAHFVG